MVYCVSTSARELCSVCAFVQLTYYRASLAGDARTARRVVSRYTADFFPSTRPVSRDCLQIHAPCNPKLTLLQCDEVRPSCTQCRKSSRVCPGYPDEFDLIFRNETAAVKRRAQRAFSNTSSKSSKTTAARYVLQVRKIMHTAH